MIKHRSITRTPSAKQQYRTKNIYSLLLFIYVYMQYYFMIKNVRSLTHCRNLKHHCLSYSLWSNINIYFGIEHTLIGHYIVVINKTVVSLSPIWCIFLFLCTSYICKALYFGFIWHWNTILWGYWSLWVRVQCVLCSTVSLRFPIYFQSALISSTHI